MTTVLQLLLVLGLMVLVHEFGHFAVAKWCGVRIETFAIGFGKRVVGTRRGGTEYQINALPLGGYVKMAGEIPGEEVSNDPGDRSSPWADLGQAEACPTKSILPQRHHGIDLRRAAGRHQS